MPKKARSMTEVPKIQNLACDRALYTCTEEMQSLTC